MARTKKVTNDKVEKAPVVKAEVLDTEEQSVEAVLSEINEVVSGLSEDTASSSPSKVIKTELAATDKIPCKNLFFGRLVYTSPTNGAGYIWPEFGKSISIPFGELQTMNNFKPQYLNKPLIFVDNAEVVEYFNLDAVYRNVANVNKFEAVLNSANISLIRKRVQEAIAVGMRDAVIAKVRKLREDNKLVDINIIKALKEELKFDIE